MKQSTYIFTALIIGLSIVSAAILFNHTVTTTVKDITLLQQKVISPNTLMTKKDLSNYLNISVDSIDKIIEEDVISKAKATESGGYDTYQFIPYLKIDDQERFIKSEIDKWLRYKAIGSES
ncbi:Clp protease ClpB [Gottfriedia sp. NPDC056225]|uniref:Clp protease ClpB n=1 Tax=Gottfriedia sp. NPDC056225 TaxID=3345751 RepID=UPI001558FFA4|nr:Clp protease ClpB [Arthrobacter citreus]